MSLSSYSNLLNSNCLYRDDSTGQSAFAIPRNNIFFPSILSTHSKKSATDDTDHTSCALSDSLEVVDIIEEYTTNTKLNQ